MAGTEKRATVMVRNIPNRYIRDTLLQTPVFAEFAGKFDFLYLPMDLALRANVGYAFVNFVSPEVVVEFYRRWHRVRWEQSNKTCEIAYGRLQGKTALLHQFRKRNSQATIPHQYRPACFHTEGPQKGEREDLAVYGII